MDANSIADALGAWIATLLVPVVAYGIALLRRWRINETVLAAIGRGAGVAYAELLRARDGATVATVERAVDAGAEYVERRIPATLGKAGFNSTDAVRDVVRAELGKLLAADPTIGPKARA